MRLGRIGLGFALAALVSGCAGAPSVDPDTGRSEIYRPGRPDFDLEAISSVVDDTTGLDIALSLPHASLIYRRDGTEYTARVRWSLRVDGTAPGSETRPLLSWEETVRLPTRAATRTFEPIVRQRRVALPAGVYLVRADVEDVGSTGIASRSVRVAVETPEAAPALGGLRLLARGDSAWVPVVSLGAVRGLDSLRAVAQATAVPDGSVATIRVVRLRADTLAALEPAALAPMMGGLRTRGVDLGTGDTLFVDEQVLARPDISIRIEAPLPMLEPGTYRIELDVISPDDDASFGASSRLLVVRRGDFPALLRVGDLIEPLVYLATRSELDALRSAQGAFAQRSAFDRFWGTLLPDRRVAAATLRAFYERAEEANRLYSTQKEGWKTDRGMVYLVFGPPERVEPELAGETWVYGSGSPLRTVRFERTATRDRDGVPYDVHTLQRDPAYDRAWRSAKRRWRRGEAL